MTPEEESLKVTERLTVLLQGCIDHLTRDGDGIKVVDEYDQHAVRILRSRMRRLWHIHDQMYGDDTTRLRAALALQLDDNGDKLTYANVNHSCGQLNCKGCDFIYIGARREPQCIVCRFCAKGVEHIRTIHGPAEYPDALGFVRVKAGEVLVWSQCDKCATRTLVPVRDEN